MSPKKKVLMRAPKNRFQISQELLKFAFSAFHETADENLFGWVIEFLLTYYNNSSRKVYKLMQYDWNCSGTRFLATEN